MGTQLPTLNAEGVVMFHSPDDLPAWWDQWVARGALAVRPAGALRPLEQLEVRLAIPGSAALMLRCEVVRLDVERTLLRLLDPPPGRPAFPAPEPTVVPGAPVNPVATASAPPPATQAPAATAPALPVHDAIPPIVVGPPPSAEVAAAAPNPRAKRTQDLWGGALIPAAETPPPATAPVAPPPPASATATLAPLAPAPATGADMEALPPLERGPVTSPEMEAAISLLPVAHDAVLPEEREAVTSPARTNGAPAPLPTVAAPAPAAPPPAPAPVAAPSRPTAGSTPLSSPAPSSAFTMPPYFSGDALRFASADDFRSNRVHLDTVGALLAVVGGAVPLKADVRLAVGTKEGSARATVTLTAASPGTAVVQAVEKGGFAPLLQEMDTLLSGPSTRTFTMPGAPSSTSVIPAVMLDPEAAAGAAAAAATPKAFALPREGAIVNPTTARGILSLPVTRTPTDAELERPSVPLLLRWIRGGKGTVRAELSSADHPAFTCIFVDGREVRTPAAMATLGKSMALPDMRYTLSNLGRPPEMTTKGRTLHLIGEVVRALVTRLEIDELARDFPNQGSKCVRAVQHVVESLGFPAQHARFIKAELDGRQFLEDAARAAVGGRTAWETLYLLELFGGLSWDDPPEGKTGPARSGNTQRISAAAVNAALDEWAPFQNKDHFHVLGLHWSSAPSEVGPAYQRMRSDYGQGGIKRPQDPAVAERVVKRIEEANKVLSDPTQRRLYRKDTFNMVWAHQAQLLVAKAKLELYRKNFVDAKNILEAAEDIHSSEEARALILAMQQAQKKAKPPTG